MAHVRTHAAVWFLAAVFLVVLASATGRAGPFGPAGQDNADAAKIKNPVASTPESIAAGKALFTRNCAPCHGINATGGIGNDISPPSPDLTDADWLHGGTDGEIFTNIKEGIPPDLNMGAFGDRLKDPDIWNVVNYVRSLAKK
jgi:cbb3-type cytochrome c oxidase subunit III